MKRWLSFFIALLTTLLFSWAAHATPVFQNIPSFDAPVVNPNAALPQVLMRVKNGVTTYYIYGAGLMYQVTETATGTNTQTYHYDYRGSTIALSGDNGVPTDRMEYSLYASTTYRAGTNDTPFLYNGRYAVQTDPNGLLYMQSRYYSPYLCRFINADPSGFAGEMNFYAYANGNPVSYLDPLGLSTVGENAGNDGGLISFSSSMSANGTYTSNNGDSAAQPQQSTSTIIAQVAIAALPIVIAPAAVVGEELLAVVEAEAAEGGAPNLFYHYTAANESLFANGLREGSSVTDTLYTNPLQASQELGIPVPNKVIPIQNVGQFVPAKPPVVQGSYRYLGGGNDFNNLQRVPPSQLLPARPIGGN